MSSQSIAVASAKSFGDFVIAHSVLHRIEGPAKAEVRLIAGSHLKDLNAILPDDVPVTFVESGENRVPALFDIKKCGPLAAFRSALSLRRRFRQIERNDNEVLAFDALGVRERFIAGSWSVIHPRSRSPNIYETYVHFFAEHAIRVAAPSRVPGSRVPGAPARSVGIFPESRLVKKRLTASTISLILDRAARARVAAKLFILDGDPSQVGEFPVVHVSRNFASLANAIRSVDCVISADSLPGHLAEYLARSVFVAAPAPNQYWLPQECFASKSWGIFQDQAGFSVSLDRFLENSCTA